MRGWDGVLITLMHRSPRSGGARVVVTQRGRHIVSSSSREGLTVDDPSTQAFLTWARGYYRGAEFREIAAHSTRCPRSGQAEEV